MHCLESDHVISEFATHVTLAFASAPKSIPDSIIHFNISKSLFTLHSLPPNVQVAKLNAASHQLLTQPGCLPQSITTLDVYAPDEIVDNVLPLGLKKLAFWQLDHPLLISLPHGLTHLILDDYRHPFKNHVLPSTLTHLTCSHRLLVVLEPGVIPNSLVELFIRTPRYIGEEDEVHLIKSGTIPDSVTSLRIQADAVKFDSLPSRLTHLKIHHCKDKLIVPDSVTHLFLYGTVIPDAFPTSLTHLYLPNQVDQSNVQLIIPPTVTHLRLSRCQILAGFIPPSVTHLVFNCLPSDKLVKGLIPDSVIYLTFDDTFDRPLDAGVIPASVTHIVFGKHFNRAIKARAIPSSTTHLYLGESFNIPIQRGAIPKSVTHLVFGNSFNQQMYPGIIPNGVTTNSTVDSKLIISSHKFTRTHMLM